jgi:hypothetical protein
MAHYLVLNAISILAIAALAFFFLPKDYYEGWTEQALKGLGTLIFLFYVSIAGWMIFIAYHFVSKYW